VTPAFADFFRMPNNPPLLQPETQAPHAAPPPASDAVRGNLESIYAEADSADLDKLEQVHHSTTRRILIGLSVFLVVLTLISWLGFFFFSPQQGGFDGEEVSVVIEGTGEPKSGELTEYLIRWRNGESVALGTAALEIRVPRSFRVLESQALPEGDTATWKIGSIGPGKSGSLSMKGAFIDEVGKEMDLQAILTYRPANFSSEFQEVATKTVRTASSAFSFLSADTRKALPGDQVVSELRFRNDSGIDIEGARARLMLPADFILDKAEPAAEDPEAGLWAWAVLNAGEEAVIKLTGSFAPNAEGERRLTAEVGLNGPNGDFLHQGEVSNVIEVFKGDLVTALIVNGQTTDQPVRFGEKMRFAVSWSNAGSVPVEEVELTAVIESTPAQGLIDWNQLEDKAGGVLKDGRITWTKKQVPALASIEPGDDGTMEFSVPLIAAPVAGSDTQDYFLTARLESSARVLGEEDLQRTVKTAPLKARLVSDTSLVAEARYFDQDNIPVGTGPLPPVVGDKTTYRINWRIGNGLHELSNLKMSTKLPDNVAWTGFSEVDAGDLRFDASTGKLVWELNRLPTSIKNLAIAFDVALIPTEQQRGRMASLIDATILEATDALTGAPMIITASPLTTALASDDSAVGKAKVE
jgi:hypothetical protein